MSISRTSIACPKDPFPLLRIDQIIDATAGHDSLCFLDAYSGYHQIKMAESDQAAAAFITPIGDITTGREPAYLGRVNFISSVKVIKQMKAQGL